ncbi:unnamed protein product, partial [Allacma fusca]
MITPYQNKVFVKTATYGSFDPEPPRDAPIEVKALGPIRFPNYTWVTDYNHSTLVGNQPAFTNAPCHRLANSPGIGRFAGRCGNTINRYWQIGQHVRLRCQNENKDRVGPGYVPHVPEFAPGGGSCAGGCEEARNNTRAFGISAKSEIGQII